MKIRYRYPILIVLSLASVLVAVFAQNGTYTPGQFQSSNPNYPNPNPFYFEGKIDWNLLGITQPQNAWEYLQRGMHFQDDLDDIPDAISDYQTSLSMNSLQNQTCQIVTAATLVLSTATVPAQLTPRSMHVHRAVAARLLVARNRVPAPRLALPGSASNRSAKTGSEHADRRGVRDRSAGGDRSTGPAAGLYERHRRVSGGTGAFSGDPQSIALTGDQANNSKVHWELAKVYEATGQNDLAESELQSYLLATQWHSDVYPWRIALARAKSKRWHERSSILPPAKRS